ncbi:hypothetical protein K5549_007209 [Capra hircus]|nr:hypothetical protein K5549_007209 [Capra hircus]
MGVGGLVLSRQSYGTPLKVLTLMMQYTGNVSRMFCLRRIQLFLPWWAEGWPIPRSQPGPGTCC